MLLRIKTWVFQHSTKLRDKQSKDTEKPLDCAVPHVRGFTWWGVDKGVVPCQTYLLPTDASVQLQDMRTAGHCQSRESRCSRSQSRFPVAHGRHLGRADIHSSACDGPQTVASWCRDTAACVKQIYPELSQPRERTHAGEERGKKSEKDGVAENSSYSSALGAIWNARNKLEKPEMSWGRRGKEGRTVCIFSLFLIIQL